MRVRSVAGASRWRGREQGLSIISGTSPRVWSELLVVSPGQWVLAGTRWGGGVVPRPLEGAGGGKVDSMG